MHRMTQVRNFHILPGHIDDLVKGLRASPNFEVDGPYIHAKSPPEGTPLVHERMRTPQLTSYGGRQLITGSDNEPKSTDYVPVVRVYGDMFSVVHTDVPTLEQYRVEALDIARPHLAETYEHQAADGASATETHT